MHPFLNDDKGSCHSGTLDKIEGIPYNLRLQWGSRYPRLRVALDGTFTRLITVFLQVCNNRVSPQSAELFHGGPINLRT